MPKNRIVIAGTIDRYAYSTSWFKYCLDTCDKGPVTVEVNSYGGDVNEALGICNLIADHGDITVEYVAFNASAATLLGLYAKHSRIFSDSLYLIHKASTWVEAWGTMNEDQIEEVIKELQGKKKVAEAATLNIAKLYARKSGRPVPEILSAMREAKWMTAEEVVEAGLVDEMVESKAKKKTLVSNDIALIFQANGVPLPGKYVEGKGKGQDEDKGIAAEIRDMIKGLLISNHNSYMDKQHQFLNSVLKTEGIEVNAGSAKLTVEQLSLLNAALKKATEEKKSAEAVCSKVQEELKNVVSGLDNLGESVKTATDYTGKIAAVKQLIETTPSTPAVIGGGDDKHLIKEDNLALDAINNFFNE